MNTSSVNKTMAGDNALSSRSELEFNLNHDEVHVIITSVTIDVIVSTVSQLAWMGTALGTSTDGRIQYCEPMLEVVLMAQEAQLIVFSITFVMSSPRKNDQSCWLPLFLDPVIA